MKHELRTWPEPFEAAFVGDKRHEIRSESDRTFSVGDALLLREWVPCPTCQGGTVAFRGRCPSCDGNRTLMGYTGRDLLVVVTCLSREAWGLPRGLVVMSFDVKARGDRG